VALPKLNMMQKVRVETDDLLHEVAKPEEKLLVTN